MEEQKFNKYVSLGGNSKGPIKSRRPVVHDDYYTEGDYEKISAELPKIVNLAMKRAGEILEPTIHERKLVREVIREFIKSKGRPIYGGSAINELLLRENPAAAIYDEYTYKDIEFYSFEPVKDLVELSNILYSANFKYVTTQEAQHEETYNLFVNFKLYCDITYCPKWVYQGIQTIDIDGIKYVHPHFILIDQIRIFNQPLTAAEERWEKTFNRMYLLMKYYPLNYYDKRINLIKNQNSDVIKSIKKYIEENEIICSSSVISGFHAYNYYIKYAIEKNNNKVQAKKDLSKYFTDPSILEIQSVNYKNTVSSIYTFLLQQVGSENISLDEYSPLFQFSGHSVVIKINDIPVTRIFNCDGSCIPNFKIKSGLMYVSYQYLLANLLISKFREHLNKNKDMYFNFGTALSNLVFTRNYFLASNDLEVINDTIFGEFKISCVGKTESFFRVGRLRTIEKNSCGKSFFRYTPEYYFSLDKEAQDKFDPGKHKFKNTSGNIITDNKYKMFKIDPNTHLIISAEEVNEEETIVE
jgi:hypothetical protein